MPKWLFYLALFFVLFLIYTQPTEAGNVAGSFAEFSVKMLDATGEFLTGLFDGASNESFDGVTTPSGTPDSTTSDTTDGSFTHFHDGELHTHEG